MRVFLFDEFKPETAAMLQALYSRSAQSVLRHVEKVQQTGTDRFMASYYVGYGHASIGDCGVTTLFLEDISLLACKAIQDNPLYSGQETSTRYIDFSKQRLVDPIGSARSESLQRRWIEFYRENTPVVIQYLKAQFPPPAGGNEKLWEKAIAARAFDILRGFLPAGVTSQCSWTTSIRQAHEQLLRLESHPLDEVRGLADQCRQLLGARYPNSFGHPVSPAERDYLAKVARQETYLPPSAASVRPGEFKAQTNIDNDVLEREALELIRSRPRKSQLPRTLARFGQYGCQFLLDFGSFRDLQRHRNGLCRMPLLTPDLGFHEWYYAQLPPQERERARSFVAEQMSELRALAPAALPEEDRQYYVPIGMNVACELVFDLPQMVYVAELRASPTVHPTLRWVAQQMALTLKARHPNLALYADMAEDEFCLRRGSQDIVARSTAA